MDSQKLKSIIESLLFVSGEPIKIIKLAKICNQPQGEITACIEEMNQDYQNGKRGLVIIRKNDIVQLATNPENAEIVGKLVSGEIDSELSRSALEVLSVIAYRGPITRVQIETIRGVNCSYTLRSLLIRGLIERKEASDVRGYLYEVSTEFLKKLGITSTRELPDWESLSRNEKIEELLTEEKKAK